MPDTNHSDLRHRAEEHLRHTRTEISEMSTEDIQELVHELQVHQIELQMQNEEISRAEREAAHTRDHYFAKLYEQAPVGYFTLSGDQKIQELNKTAQSLLDMDPSEIIGRPITRFVPPSDQDTCYILLRKVGKTGNAGSVEVWFKRGEDREFRARIRAVHGGDRHKDTDEILATIADITEEYEAREALSISEQRYRFLYENAQTANFILTADGIVEDINTHALVQIGYWKEEVVGRPLVEFVWPEQRERISDWLRDATQGRNRPSADIALRTREGKTRTFMASAAPEKPPEGGKTTRLMCSAVDITKRKRMEDELLRRTEDLTAVNKELEAFAHSVSHDLRNPLNNTQAMTDMLIQFYSGNLDADGKRCVAEIATNTQRMTATISDLLRLARLGQQESVPEAVDLSELAHSVIEDLRRTKPRSNIEIVVREKMTATIDKGIMRSALENLLENAWKYTSNKENARIEFSCTESEDRTVYFVRDNGEGFDPRHANKLFEPFRRLSTSHPYEGSGIGLSIVQRIVAMNGGRIWALGEPGVGATFYFTLGDR